MKTIKLFTVLILSIVIVSRISFATSAYSPSFLGISIIMTSKAYWDGPTKSCLPRDKGFCCHIAFNTMPGHGQISGTLEVNESNILVLSVSKPAGLDRETYNEYFSKDKFILDGDLTFSQEVLNKLRLPAGFTISSGEYPYTTAGETIRIYFK
jgi:hypothetical protein